MSQAPQKVRSLVSQSTIPFNRDIKCGSLPPSLPYPCGQLKNVGGFITHSEAGLQLHAVDKIQSLNAFILPLSSILMAEQRTPVSLSLPNPFSIWAHFLSLPYLTISSYQEPIIYFFLNWICPHCYSPFSCLSNICGTWSCSAFYLGREVMRYSFSMGGGTP